MKTTKLPNILQTKNSKASVNIRCILLCFRAVLLLRINFANSELVFLGEGQDTESLAGF